MKQIPAPMMMTCMSLVVILTGTTVTIRRRSLYHWIGASMEDLGKIGTFCSHLDQIPAEYTGLSAGCPFGSRRPRSVSHPVNNVTRPQQNSSSFLGVKCAVIKQTSDLSQDYPIFHHGHCQVDRVRQYVESHLDIALAPWWHFCKSHSLTGGHWKLTAQRSSQKLATTSFCILYVTIQARSYGQQQDFHGVGTSIGADSTTGWSSCTASTDQLYGLLPTRSRTILRQHGKRSMETG